MSEYNDIQARMLRIEHAYKEVTGRNDKGVSMGTARGNIDGEGFKDGFYASIGDIIEYRPTIGGALVAVEQRLYNNIDDRLSEMQKLVEIQKTLKPL